MLNSSLQLMSVSPSITPISSTLTTFALSSKFVKNTVMSSPSKSCSLDPIPTILLEMFIDNLSVPLTSIINQSLSSGDVPSSFKHGLVFPSIKKTTLDPEAFDNFRPITNLSFLSKTVERLVAIQLRCTAIQSAYRAHHSTETAAVPKQPYFESITTPT